MKQYGNGRLVILKVKLKEDKFNLLKRDIQQQQRVCTVTVKSNEATVCASLAPLQITT
jgi:hypothetical protein